MASAGIIGMGSWGSALAYALGSHGHHVTMWSKFEDEVKMLQKKHEHITKLPGVILPEEVFATISMEDVCSDKDILVFAVPSIFVRSTAKEAAPYIKKGQLVVNVAKGIEDDSLKLLSEILREELPQAQIAVLSGPSHAEEVGRRIPTTLVAGASDEEAAKRVQDIFMSDVLRVYTSPDVTGIELGGALKNVIALAAGVIDGLGYGDNTKAALMTRGIAEMSRLGTACGGYPETFFGLSGIGDLIVTCTSRHSRNRKCGYLIGQGYTLDAAMKEVSMVVEGVYCARAALAMAQKYSVDMPITAQVNDVLFENKPAKTAVTELFLRDGRIENQRLSWHKN